ncbi:hypothetical protein [Mangrovicoccus ximenensis]|uniref:hypothetical protein n=1 Tax=Mangrovicoccus ximenensis TaxID=1911570 RepID=UPI000D38204A|nr:hypothetical protein [Mangrovicoccus ximenensis]
MTPLLWVLAGIAAAIAAAALAEAWIKRGRRRPLAAHRPVPDRDRSPELGMEATDLDGYRRLLRQNDQIGAQRTRLGTFRAGIATDRRAPDRDQGDNA